MKLSRRNSLTAGVTAGEGTGTTGVALNLLKADAEAQLHRLRGLSA